MIPGTGVAIAVLGVGVAVMFTGATLTIWFLNEVTLDCLTVLWVPCTGLEILGGGCIILVGPR